MLVHQTPEHAYYLSKHQLKSHLHLQSPCLPDKLMLVSLARGGRRDWRNQCVKRELQVMERETRTFGEAEDKLKMLKCDRK